MAIKMDGHTITELELRASNGTTITKQLTEKLNLQQKTATVNGDVTADIGYDGLSKVIVNVSGGGELPALTNPASASDILSSKEAIDGNGAKLTGICTYDADTSDANATASDILQGKTAYVNGSKIIGTATGGGGITDGVEVLERDSNGYATSIRHWGASVRKAQYGCDDVNYSPSHVVSFINIEQVDLNNATTIGQVAFCATHLTSVASSLVTSLGVGAFAKCVSLISANFPNAFTDTNLFMNCTALKTVILKNFSNGSQIFKGCTALENVTIGGIGAQCGVPASDNIFSGCEQSGLTVTVYCKGNDGISNIVSKIRSGATNAIIVVKASHDTTYEDQSYSAGDTILTDSPSMT